MKKIIMLKFYQREGFEVIDADGVNKELEIIQKDYIVHQIINPIPVKMSKSNLRSRVYYILVLVEEKL